MVLETDAYTETISILNDIEGVSIAKVDGKKTVYITLDCEKDRIDAQNNVEKHLKKVAQPIRTNKSAKSSFDLTELRGTNIFIVYKNKKGGMKETTLNSTITELFPSFHLFYFLKQEKSLLVKQLILLNLKRRWEMLKQFLDG